MTNNAVVKRLVGGDIDQKAIAEAKKTIKNADFICRNSLLDVCRKNFTIKDKDELIII